MSYKSLTHFINALEAAGELVRIKEPVSPDLEITEIADRMVKHEGPALLFENTGTEFPLLINAFASDRRICLALGVGNLDEIGKRIDALTSELLGPKERFIEKLKLLPALQQISSWLPRVIHGKGACQEVVMKTPDLNRLPVLKCWPADGGPFITLPGVHTRDPQTGIRNLGMYRMQVFGPDVTGMHWHLHKGSATHFKKYKELGKRMPVTVTLGGDPVYTYAATAPLPENLDEYMFAGFLRKKKVELVRCLTNELEVPGDVDFVIEGYVDPQEELIMEGPFGDHTGFYSLEDQFPKFHVTCITHRREAVYPATIVGIPPMEDGWIGKATEKIFRSPIRMTVAQELEGMHMPPEGVFHNIVLAGIRKSYPGQAVKVMNSLWGAGQMMFNKFLLIFDHDVDLTDYKAVARIISLKVDPSTDVHYIRGPMDILDHSGPQYAFGSKAGIDATEKFPEERQVALPVHEPFCDSHEILAEFPEIKHINAALLDEGISVIILSVIKNRRQLIRHLGEAIFEKGWIKNVRFLLFLDSPVDVSDISGVIWLAAGNTDPLRDIFTIRSENGTPFHSLAIDATRKNRKFDDFERHWPNIIVMSDDVVGKIDRKWKNYGLGDFIPSPSLRFKLLKINDQAQIY
jgi:4-hydroxy-3-polyprenylbenzoate decarboxylase